MALLVELGWSLLGQVTEEIGGIVDEPIQRDRELLKGVRPQALFDTGNRFHRQTVHRVPESLSRGRAHRNREKAGQHALLVPCGDSVLTFGLTDPIDGSEHQILAHVEIRGGGRGVRVDQRDNSQVQSLLVKSRGEPNSR